MKTKKLIFIGGTTCSGKTTTARKLLNELNSSVMLDGDWCFEQGSDWHFDDETMERTVDNICYVLNNHLHNKNFENIIFSWILHQKSVIDRIINYLKEQGHQFEFYNITLMCDTDVIYSRLVERIEKISKELSDDEYCKGCIKEIFNGAVKKIPDFSDLDTKKIDVSNMTLEEVTNQIIEIAGLNKREKCNSIYRK